VSVAGKVVVLVAVLVVGPVVELAVDSVVGKVVEKVAELVVDWAVAWVADLVNMFHHLPAVLKSAAVWDLSAVLLVAVLDW